MWLGNLCSMTDEIPPKPSDLRAKSVYRRCHSFLRDNLNRFSYRKIHWFFICPRTLCILGNHDSLSKFRVSMLNSVYELSGFLMLLGIIGFFDSILLSLAGSFIHPRLISIHESCKNKTKLLKIKIFAWRLIIILKMIAKNIEQLMNS